MSSFTAKYRSKLPCPTCGLHVEVGESMTWTRRGDSKVYHANCYGSNSGNGSGNGASSASSGTAYAPTNTSSASGTAVVMAKEPKSDTDAMTALYNAIQAIAGNSVSRESVESICNEKLADVAANTEAKIAELENTVLELIGKQSRELIVTVRNGADATTRNVGKTHKQFEMLLKLCAAHTVNTPINVWITGPAGSGKTKAAHQASEALGLPFYFSGAIAEPYSLLGYMDANGKLVRTAFREAYENGGIFLQDEIDGSSANALLSFNAALANGHCAFPDGVIARHKDCIIIAAANTFGLGGTSDYVGRVKLDAATLSRYVWLDWPYDEELERSLCQNQDWANRVIAIRHKVQSLGMKLLVTPRATYTGDVLLASGIEQSHVEAMVLKQGMTTEQWNQIKAGA